MIGRAHCHPDPLLAKGSAFGHEWEERPRPCAICRHNEDGNDAVHCFSIPWKLSLVIDVKQRTPVKKAGVKPSISWIFNNCPLPLSLNIRE
jgi:hypothetical protein